MRNIRRILGGGVVAAFGLVLLAGSPMAAGAPPPPPTVNFNLTSPGSGDNLAGVYTSPYAGYINNNSPTAIIRSGRTVPVICDDFSDNSFIEEDWTANVTTLSSIIGKTDTPADLKWNGANVNTTVGGVTYDWSLSQADAYTVAALLSIDILRSNPKGCTVVSKTCTAAEIQSQEDYSYALWELFDPTVVAGQKDQNTKLPTITDAVVPWLAGDSGPGSDLAKATAYLTTAIKQVTSGYLNGKTGETVSSYLSNYTVKIYSYDPIYAPTCNGGTCESSPPQEFIRVPEASSLAAFSVYFLFGGGSLLFFGGRRIFRSDS